ncbi:hypothetical protein L6452_12535 [Arctium lappa]|uniref:Uncharacterized protein n=1 Tax=Arctium lappa TaxID=4217 RepID=A0ACB9DQM7_ARCLA|nr:hypothetical protein L6452_12535 [Arctium lappa]
MATLIQFHTSSPTTEHCSTSDCSTTGSCTFSDEEVKLASRNPKKRAGRKKFKETRHPVYRGVRRRDSGKWVCEVREPNKKTRLWLGTYPTADMAARAHDVAVLAMKGRSACLNFADSLWRLPVPESGDLKDIRRAAVEGAEAFRPVECEEAEVEESKELAAGNVFCTDEEPGFFGYMAEGLMLPPPITVGYDNCDDDVEFSVDASLWTF